MRRNTLQATVGSDTVPGDMKDMFLLSRPTDWKSISESFATHTWQATFPVQWDFNVKKKNH